jgi:simple sugar transport system permease protein
MIGTRWRRFLLGAAAPVGALAFSVVITSLLLVTTGHSPAEAFGAMAGAFERSRIILGTVNQSAIYYLSAVAVAIGFKMNLFNIGVDGQYRLAALAAAAVGGTVALPGPVNVVLMILVAMAVGAMWSGIAGLLRAWRGVSEVISTIMLNAISTAVIAYLLRPGRLAVQTQGSNNIGTKPIPESGRVPGISLIPDAGMKVFGLIVVAILVGVGYSVLLNRTVFGFDLRATGGSQTAAVASGVNVKRMLVIAMVLSGAVAGLVGLPQLVGQSYSYSLDFPTGLGFTGIAIALLGRNHPVGIAFGALLWAFLDQSSQILDLEGVPKEIVTIIQGATVLSVVIAYELVRRYRLVAEQRNVGRALGRTAEPPLVTAGTTGSTGSTGNAGATGESA